MNGPRPGEIVFRLRSDEAGIRSANEDAHDVATNARLLT
jgi:hypothetical protein